MNITEVLDRFNKKLNENTWWARFVNSQFVQMMAVLGSQVIYIAQTYASRALAEGFISTATRRSSILAAAEDRGYVGRFVESSWGTVSIKNKTEQTIILPPGAEVLTNDQTPLALVSSVEIPAGQTLEGVAVKQHEAVSVEFDVEAEKAFLTLLLDRDITAEVSELSVVVITGEEEETWTRNPLFRMSRSDSKHYVLVYKPTEQLGIRFGDGSMGMMPPAGSKVRIDLLASLGDFTLAEGQKLEAAGNISKYIDALEIVTDSIITGGGGMESTEETRNRAQYYVPYDEQVIWGGDYRSFVQGVVSGTSWLNIWGEAIQEKLTGFDVRNINRIWFCGHKPGVSQEQLGKEILEALEDVPNELNKHFEYVPTNKLPFTIVFSGIARKNVLIDDAKAAIKKALEKNFGEDSSSFSLLLQSDDDSQQCYAQVKIKDIWRVIEALGLFISYDIEVVDMTDAVQMNDFVYLDVAASNFDSITYP
ncbi:TPA: baseplate protein [Klebsiella variicola subsp. variicola]|nr:baseplate protein [Klebsiella variicola subsp. variicola]